MWKRRPIQRERIEFDPEKKDYTIKELDQLADQFLKDDARSISPETGKPKGIGGKDPILFEEHIYQRKKREIINENGVPEPGLVQGIYDRIHPEGRKVNSPEQRKRNGASWYRVVIPPPFGLVPTWIALAIGCALFLPLAIDVIGNWKGFGIDDPFKEN